jgi:hypothetical protein
MTFFIAMRLSNWRAIESGGQDAFIKHQYTTDKGSIAGTAL